MAAPVSLLLLLAAVPGPTAWLDAVVELRAGSSTCAGFLVGEEGTVVTAWHCVTAVRRAEVRTRDGERVRARVRTGAPREDLAVLDAPELAGRPGLPLADAPPAPGSAVWALGHPYATVADRAPELAGLLRWSVSRGVVSAVGERLLQVDAALNPGNSGGPVLDEAGRVVGVASRRIRAEGIAFAVPVERLRPLLDPASPRPRWWGGSAVPRLALALPLEPAGVPSLLPEVEVRLRDRVVLLGGMGLPLGARWAALERGEASWQAWELALMVRQRVGRGPWSATVDLGGGWTGEAGWRAALGADGLLETEMYLPATDPAGFLRLGWAGVSLRGTVARAGTGWRPGLVVGFALPGLGRAF